MRVILFFWNWIVQSTVAFDRFINAFFLFGKADETVSRRMGRNHHRCRLCRITCRVLDLITFSDDHCKRNPPPTT